MNTECSDKFEGASFCPDDNAVSVNAPYGYQTYTWYNSTFTQVLGNQQTLTLTPPPTSGTTVAVIVVPFSGYGCLDTLYLGKCTVIPGVCLISIRCIYTN